MGGTIGKLTGCKRHPKKNAPGSQIVPGGNGSSGDDLLNDLENGNSPKPVIRDLNPQDPGSSGGEQHGKPNSLLVNLRKVKDLHNGASKAPMVKKPHVVVPKLSKRKSITKTKPTKSASKNRKSRKSLKKRKSLPGIRKKIPTEEILSLSFMKIFKDGLRNGSKCMDAERLRMVVANVCATRNRSPPSRSETKRMVHIMCNPVGTDLTKEVSETESIKINGEQFVRTMMVLVHIDKYRQHSSGTRPQELPLEELKQCRKFRVFTKIVLRNYESRVVFLHRTFKIYSSLQGKMGYDELQTVLTYFAPDSIYEFTIDESCLLLGVIKSASGRSESKKRATTINANHENVHLNEMDFMLWVMRGSYQSDTEMRTYIDRSIMHKKIYHCLFGFTHLADREERKRIENGEAMPEVVVSQREVLKMMMNREAEETSFF